MYVNVVVYVYCTRRSSPNGLNIRSLPRATFQPITAGKHHRMIWPSSFGGRALAVNCQDANAIEKKRPTPGMKEVKDRKSQALLVNHIVFKGKPLSDCLKDNDGK